MKTLREAGAIILGKTNLSEFANFYSGNSVSGYSGLGGQVLTPIDLDQNPSGSSFGSATDPPVAMIQSLGAVTVEIPTPTASAGPGILNYEFKRDLNAYFARRATQSRTGTTTGDAAQSPERVPQSRFARSS